MIRSLTFRGGGHCSKPVELLREATAADGPAELMDAGGDDGWMGTQRRWGMGTAADAWWSCCQRRQVAGRWRWRDGLPVAAGVDDGVERSRRVAVGGCWCDAEIRRWLLVRRRCVRALPKIDGSRWMKWTGCYSFNLMGHLCSRLPAQKN
jgi:hypothetical protein